MKLAFILLLLNSPILATAHDVPNQYVVMHTKGPNWPTDQKVPYEHPELMKHAKYWGEQAIIEVGGPFEGTFEDIMLLKPGTSLEEAKKVSAEGPAVKSGMLKAEVRRWLQFIEKAKAPGKKKPERKK